MDNTEDFFKNYRGKYSQYWIERWGLIPELPTSFDNANSVYELMAWLQRAFKNLLDDFQGLEAEFEDFKNALIDLLEYLIPELIRRYSDSAEFRALFIILLEDILAGEERNWVKDLLKELMEVDMRDWLKDFVETLYNVELSSRLSNIEQTMKKKNSKEIDFLDYGFIPNDSSAEAHNNALFAQLMLEEGNLSINVSAGNRFWIGNVTISRGEFNLYGGGTITGNLICDEGYLKNHIFINDITFKFDSMSNDNNPIVLSELTRSAIKHCYFLNCNKAISYKSLDNPQRVSRILIDNNYMRNVNYGLYGTRPESFRELLIVADIHFTNNVVENCFVEHIHAEGFDGGIISNNTFFFPGNALKSKDKQNNIYMKWLQWTIISNNNIFEAGKDGIHLERAENITISGNNIAWPGQNQPGSGIKIINYSKAGGIVVKGTITGNMIDQPSESGIYIDDNTGYMTVSSNSIYEAGSTKYYYGTEQVTQKWGVYLGQTSQGVVVTGNNISHNNIQNSGTLNVLKVNLTLHNTGHTNDISTKDYTVTINSGSKIANFSTGLNTDDITGFVVLYNDANFANPANAYLNANSTVNIVTSSEVTNATTYTVRVSYRKNLKN